MKKVINYSPVVAVLRVAIRLFTLLLLIGVLSVTASSCSEDDEESNVNTFTDSRDGKVYKTVTIGTQVWMAENLKYLPSVVEPAIGSESTPYYYVYGYDGTNVTEAKAKSNYSTYGVLYNWDAAKAACPAGWHLPTREEWIQLTDFLGGVGVAGGKLKEAGTTHWDNPNEGATNETGFTAIPGGNREVNGTFSNLGAGGFWWTSTEDGISSAKYLHVYYYGSGISSDDYTKEAGFSVRCIKD